MWGRGGLVGRNPFTYRPCLVCHLFKLAHGSHLLGTEVSLTHVTKLGEVLLGRLVLLVLVDPPIEIRLEVVHLGLVLGQAGPVLLSEFLLLQFGLDLHAGVQDLGLVRVDRGIELKIKVVGSLEGVGAAAKREGLVLDVQFQVVLGDVGDDDR